jgi:hypothetical protein
MTRRQPLEEAHGFPLGEALLGEPDRPVGTGRRGIAPETATGDLTATKRTLVVKPGGNVADTPEGTTRLIAVVLGI